MKKPRNRYTERRWDRAPAPAHGDGGTRTDGRLRESKKTPPKGLFVIPPRRVRNIVKFLGGKEGHYAFVGEIKESMREDVSLNYIGRVNESYGGIFHVDGEGTNTRLVLTQRGKRLLGIFKILENEDILEQCVILQNAENIWRKHAVLPDKLLQKMTAWGLLRRGEGGKQGELIYVPTERAKVALIIRAYVENGLLPRISEKEISLLTKMGEKLESRHYNVNLPVFELGGTPLETSMNLIATFSEGKQTRKVPRALLSFVGISDRDTFIKLFKKLSKRQLCYDLGEDAIFRFIDEKAREGERYVVPVVQVSKLGFTRSIIRVSLDKLRRKNIVVKLGKGKYVSYCPSNFFNKVFTPTEVERGIDSISWRWLELYLKMRNKETRMLRSGYVEGLYRGLLVEEGIGKTPKKITEAFTKLGKRGLILRAPGSVYSCNVPNSTINLIKEHFRNRTDIQVLKNMAVLEEVDGYNHLIHVCDSKESAVKKAVNHLLSRNLLTKEFRGKTVHICITESGRGLIEELVTEGFHLDYGDFLRIVRGKQQGPVEVEPAEFVEEKKTKLKTASDLERLTEQARQSIAGGGEPWEKARKSLALSWKDAWSVKQLLIKDGVLEDGLTPVREGILRMISKHNGKMTRIELADAARRDPSTISEHMAILTALGLVTQERKETKKGHPVTYLLTNKAWAILDEEPSASKEQNSA
jgi:DNA-binding MarR family transcriptional regulator